MPRQAEEVLQYEDFLGWTVSFSSLKDFLSLNRPKARACCQNIWCVRTYSAGEVFTTTDLLADKGRIFPEVEFKWNKNRSKPYTRRDLD